MCQMAVWAPGARAPTAWLWTLLESCTMTMSLWACLRSKGSETRPPLTHGHSGLRHHRHAAYDDADSTLTQPEAVMRCVALPPDQYFNLAHPSPHLPNHLIYLFVQQLHLLFVSWACRSTTSSLLLAAAHNHLHCSIAVLTESNTATNLVQINTSRH